MSWNPTEEEAAQRRAIRRAQANARNEVANRARHVTEERDEALREVAKWRELYIRSIEWIAWFMEKYDLAEDVTPQEVDDTIRQSARAEREGIQHG